MPSGLACLLSVSLESEQKVCLLLDECTDDAVDAVRGSVPCTARIVEGFSPVCLLLRQEGCGDVGMCLPTSERIFVSRKEWLSNVKGACLTVNMISCFDSVTDDRYDRRRNPTTRQPDNAVNEQRQGGIALRFLPDMAVYVFCI